MKWSEEKVNQLKELAFADVPNPQIAKQLEIGVSDVYAKRSQLGITREKVQAVKENQLIKNSQPQQAPKRTSKEITRDLQAQLRALPVVLGEIGVLTVELLDVQGLLEDTEGR